MTGRVFTKLLLSFFLVLSLGTSILDFSLRRFVQHSLERRTAAHDTSLAHRMAEQIAVTPPEELAAVVRAQALSSGAEVAVTDGAGHLLAAANGAAPEAPPSLGAEDHEMFGAAANPVGSPMQEDESLLLALHAGANLAHFRFPLRPVQVVQSLLRRDLLLASLLSLLLATLLATYLAWRVVARLSRIVQFANRVASGELTARVEEGRLDEISDVVHALDTTAARLEESFRELEGSRRELAVLLDSMQEAVIGVSPTAGITWSNTRMRALSPSALREGRPLVECIRDPEVLGAVERAIREKMLSRGRATSFLPGRVFAVSAAPMPDGGAVVVLHDVTEVERVERMRRDFVANVSHELRTPLTSITGYVETVLDCEEQLSAQGREFLEVVLRNGTRMHRLTQDLLALATVESGDYRLQLQPLAASILVDDALDSLAGMALETGVALERAETPDTRVMADLDALHQVFGNLIENALKYGRAGGRVRVGARDAGQSVEFCVEDFGQGIASEHLHRIFERFYRVDKARSREVGGTGLGLAIVKHLVLAHRGQIHVESELGAGARFVFSLPKAPEPEAASAPAERSSALREG